MIHESNSPGSIRPKLLIEFALHNLHCIGLLLNTQAILTCVVIIHLIILVKSVSLPFGCYSMLFAVLSSKAAPSRACWPRGRASLSKCMMRPSSAVFNSRPKPLFLQFPRAEHRLYFCGPRLLDGDSVLLIQQHCIAK